MPSDDIKFKRVGSKVNVTINDTVKPIVIIQPKSIIGFISLNIKDKNAQIVVRTVYRIGHNIFPVVKNIVSLVDKLGLFFLSCKREDYVQSQNQFLKRCLQHGEQLYFFVF